MPIGRDQNESVALIIDIPDFSGLLRPQEFEVRFFQDFLLVHATALRPHSGLMLAARITLAHFSVSATIRSSKAAGETASGVPPSSASCAFILGSATMALTAPLSLSMMSGGVLLGAPMPSHGLAS